MAKSTVAELISQIERRSFAPANQSSFTSTEILNIASEELSSKIVPAMVAVREDYYLAYQDQDITSGVEAYTIPDRSFNSTVREVKILRGQMLLNIPRISPEKLTTVLSGQPSAFYIQGDSVILHPKPSSTVDSLRLHYVLEPGEFIESASSAVISAINTTTKVVTVTTIPDAWVTGDTFDFVSKSGAHGYIDVDLDSSLVSGTDITFSELPASLSVGDYVMPQGESSLVQLPRAMVPVLAQFAAASLLIFGGQPGGEEARDIANEMLEVAVKSLTPRVVGEQEYITQPWF